MSEKRVWLAWLRTKKEVWRGRHCVSAGPSSSYSLVAVWQIATVALMLAALGRHGSSSLPCLGPLRALPKAVAKELERVGCGN